MRTLSWKLLGGTLLIVHANASPSEQEWEALTRAGTEWGTRIRRALVFGDVPLTVKQRRQIAEVVRTARSQAVAVVTSSAMARMMITSIGWATGIHKAFDMEQVEEALDYLNVGPADRRELLQVARRLAQELDNRAVEAAVASAQRTAG
jgi:hypothetical protein